MRHPFDRHLFLQRQREPLERDGSVADRVPPGAASAASRASLGRRSQNALTTGSTSSARAPRSSSSSTGESVSRPHRGERVGRGHLPGLGHGAQATLQPAANARVVGSTPRLPGREHADMKLRRRRSANVEDRRGQSPMGGGGLSFPGLGGGSGGGLGGGEAADRQGRRHRPRDPRDLLAVCVGPQLGGDGGGDLRRHPRRRPVLRVRPGAAGRHQDAARPRRQALRVREQPSSTT